jgi:hypothetical protein
MTYAAFKATAKAIWQPSAEFDAQSCHWAWGGLLTLFLAHWWGWWAFAAVLLYSTVKEGILDVWIEEDPFFWSGALDLLFWLIGCLFGMLLWWLT